MHGWQRQPNLKTVEGLIKKTLNFVLPTREFKILGAGRTDAMVSAQEGAFELFLEQKPLENPKEFLALFNTNLPPDIRALDIKEVDSRFNIIQDSKNKKYIYLFAFGSKSHPFCAPFLATFLDELDLENMKRAAKLFVGRHLFHNYCSRVTEKKRLEREIFSCKIVENNFLKANFFPKNSYALCVESEGFGRNQIRLMMGTLVLLGRGEISLEDIKESLLPESKLSFNFVAPGSGLSLNSIDFNFNSET